MSALPEPTIRLRLDATNPGHFLACCGLLELADRAWKSGAEGWFEERADFFCIAPIEKSSSEDFGASALLAMLRASTLSNALMSDAQKARLDALSEKKLKGSADAQSEKLELEALWDRAKDGALALGEPFGLRIDWHLDDRAGGSRFKTWAGQQTITPIAKALKVAADEASVDTASQDWLLTRAPCTSSLHLDAVGGGSDIDVGFSFDPLKIGSESKSVLVELLAFIGLQRFRPRKPAKDNRYVYVAWFDPLVPEVANAAASGSMNTAPARVFEFRLLYRTNPATAYVEEGLLVKAEENKARDAQAERGFVHVPASWSHGGVIAKGGIRRDATLHLAALRLLHAKEGKEPTLALQRYILGLALTAFTFAPPGYLRQGCHLVLDPDKARELKTVHGDGRREDAAVPDDTKAPLTPENALAYAKLAAKAFGVGKDRTVPFDSELAKRDLLGDSEEKKSKSKPKK
jgi:CRISPR-associated protein Csx14